MALSIKLGTCSDDIRTVNKSPSLSQTPTSCKVIHPNDVIRPVVELVYNSAYDGYNYAYIEEFHRYYYIDSITMSSATTCTISMHCDVLKSFESSILELPMLFNRKESASESYIQDTNLIITRDTETTDLVFSGEVTYSNDNNYVLYKLKG